MHFKLIIVIIDEEKTDKILNVAREVGATGATVLNHARGKGIMPIPTFLGLDLDALKDVILLLVEEHLSRKVLERIAEVGELENRAGVGIAFQIDVEDTMGLSQHVRQLMPVVEENL